MQNVKPIWAALLNLSLSFCSIFPWILFSYPSFLQIWMIALANMYTTTHIHSHASWNKDALIGATGDTCFMCSHADESCTYIHTTKRWYLYWFGSCRHGLLCICVTSRSVQCWLLSVWRDVESLGACWWMGVLSLVRSSCLCAVLMLQALALLLYHVFATSV